VLCAIVNNNVVTAIQTLNPNDGTGAYQAAAQSCQILIDITNTVPQPQVGWTFNGSTLVSNGATSMLITKLAFRERFTAAEIVGIIQASQLQNTEGYEIQMLLQNQSLATFVDLTRSDVAAGMLLLESFGLLTAGRANTILTTPPTAIEIYQG